MEILEGAAGNPTGGSTVFRSFLTLAPPGIQPEFPPPIYRKKRRASGKPADGGTITWLNI
jgi:hypothetical protein